MPIQQMLLGVGGVLEADPGQAVLSPGTTSWTCPAGVTSISVLAIGAGGASGTSLNGPGGGGMGYRNNITVSPGTSYTVSVPDKQPAGSTGGTGGNAKMEDEYGNTLVAVSYTHLTLPTSDLV